MTSNNILEVPVAERAGALAIIAGSDPREAEKSLCLIAGQIGDNAVIELLAETTPVAVAVILAGHDVGSPTIAFQLLEPEKVVAALEAAPSLWEPVEVSEDLGKIQRSVLQTFFGFFHEADPCRIRDILEAIRESEIATTLLRFVFADWNPKDEEWEGIDLGCLEEEDTFTSALSEKIESARLMYVSNTAGHLFELIREVDVDYARELLEWVMDQEDELGVWNAYQDLVASCQPEKKVVAVMAGMPEKTSSIFE